VLHPPPVPGGLRRDAGPSRGGWPSTPSCARRSPASWPCTGHRRTSVGGCGAATGAGPAGASAPRPSSKTVYQDDHHHRGDMTRLHPASRSVVARYPKGAAALVPTGGQHRRPRRVRHTLGFLGNPCGRIMVGAALTVIALCPDDHNVHWPVTTDGTVSRVARERMRLPVSLRATAQARRLVNAVRNRTTPSVSTAVRLGDFGGLPSSGHAVFRAERSNADLHIRRSGQVQKCPGGCLLGRSSRLVQSRR